MHKTVYVFLAAVLLAAAAMVTAAATSTPGAATAESKLGPRSIDPGNGFSLCPPDGAERDLAVSATRLARWVMRDARTGAIAWQLIIRKETVAGEVTMAALASQLGDSLRKQPAVRVEKTAEATVAGKPGVEAAYTQSTAGQRWQHELWAQRGPGEFLVLSISGALSLRGEMEELLGLVAATWQLMDPRQQAELRKENLHRGADLLASVTPAKLAEAVAGEAQWFLYRRGESDAGFMRVTCKQAGAGQPQGAEVSTLARLNLPDGQSVVIRRVMFSSANRSTERWTENAEVLRGGKVIRRMSESGTCEGGLIACTVESDGKSATRKKALEPAAARNYLPRALAILLPKLADLSKPAAYGFATYTTSANEFDLRTFTVIGPATTAPAGTQGPPAVEATDQLAADAAPATMSLTSDGTLLRMSTDAGIVMQRSTRSAVLRRFPDAEK
jgi:hypothetical protein